MTAAEPAATHSGVGLDDGTIVAQLRASPLDAEARRWVMAALHSEDALSACLRGEEPDIELPDVQVPPPAAPVLSYLGRVEVRGFRGIGPAAELPLSPQPGLTVIVGRNGSGKSSFAEAIEAALTGRNRRWDAMPAAWRDGWRNLHAGDRTEVAVDIHTSDRPQPMRVVRWWTGESIRSARGEVHHPDGRATGLRDLGWRDDLVRYRPFLSYDELGRAVTGRSAELYDTLTELLGLTPLAEAERRLARACDRLSKQYTRPQRDHPVLVERLGHSRDPRARRAVELLQTQDIDLSALASLAADDSPADPDQQRLLRRLRRLAIPERGLMADVSGELRGAAMELEMAEDSKGARARGLIELLRAGLAHAERHPAETECPLCHASNAMGAAWAARAREELARLEPVAAGVAAAYERVENARDQARFLMAPRPAWLPADSDLGRIWEEWAAGASLTEPGELARHIDDVGPRLRSAAVAARKRATEHLENPEGDWSEHAEQLAAWVADAREAGGSARMLAPASRALQWLGDTARTIREQRLHPLSAHAEQVWRMLRQERHIDLQSLRLVGRGAQRRLAVDVRVDGEQPQVPESNAPGLLSQGEFQALALSICLPRTQIAGNPFGFLVLDDPVQAMDTETVEGLATVLARVGGHRQLVVFTHDTRLPDALRRLGLPADLRHIRRDEQSRVWMEQS